MVSGLNWPMVVSILRNLIRNDLCAHASSRQRWHRSILYDTLRLKRFAVSRQSKVEGYFPNLQRSGSKNPALV